ncbi:MAG: iron-containing alcohol dehydrogenase [Planctomycetes bacterium]|nr:iron-containing alcohol dehydrogenase [Planctomycetota bacterium]
MAPFVARFPTRIIFGLGEVARLPGEARALGRRALLVTGRATARRHGYLDLVRQMLAAQGVEATVFGGVEENPTVATVNRGAVAAGDCHAEMVIALGGGSAMDAAKAVAVAALAKRETIWTFVRRDRKDSPRRAEHALPIICVPTLAGSGSEANEVAVVSNPETREKLAFRAECMFPRVAVVDPDFTCSASAPQTAWGAFDIVSHALETYLSGTEYTPLQDRFSEAIVRTVRDHLQKAIDSPLDKPARAALSWCSTAALGGVLAGRRGTYPIHWIEHALSAHYPALQHGRGIAMLLPHVMAFTAQKAPAKCAQLAREVFGVPRDGAADADAAAAGLKAFIAWQKETGAREGLTEAGVSAEALDRIADDVLRLHGVPIAPDAGDRGERLLPNSRPIDRAGLKSILQAALAG